MILGAPTVSGVGDGFTVAKVYWRISLLENQPGSTAKYWPRGLVRLQGHKQIYKQT
jgi:hypothetical protein